MKAISYGTERQTSKSMVYIFSVNSGDRDVYRERVSERKREKKSREGEKEEEMRKKKEKRERAREAEKERE